MKKYNVGFPTALVVPDSEPYKYKVCHFNKKMQWWGSTCNLTKKQALVFARKRRKKIRQEEGEK